MNNINDYIDDRDELTKLADDFGTDKGSRKHNYTPAYHKHFKYIRCKVRKILEIGVGKGSSVVMWMKYFNPDIVVGLDIAPQAIVRTKHQLYKFLGQEATNNFIGYVGNQTDYDMLKHIVDQHGKFDFIIDDGSHRHTDEQKTLIYLFPFLTHGGTYIIEDLHVTRDESACPRFIRTDTWINNIIRFNDYSNPTMIEKKYRVLENQIATYKEIRRKHKGRRRTKTCIF